MSHARGPRDARAASDPGAGEEDRSLTAKVVLMELARAEGPISASALAERTLLSAEAVQAALTQLADADVCTVRPGDERRPTRYQLEAAPSRA
jgi:DNA-binding MarR family transcriptional regulator